MSRDASDIRLDIEDTREQLTRSLVALRNSVADAADWRTWVRRRPLAFVAGAFAVGIIVGAR